MSTIPDPAIESRKSSLSLASEELPLRDEEAKSEDQLENREDDDPLDIAAFPIPDREQTDRAKNYLASLLFSRTQHCKHNGSCGGNVLRGTLYNFARAFGLKLALSLVIMLLKRKLSLQVMLRTVFSADAMRFSAFWGSLTGIYLLVLCAMRRARGKEDGRNALLAGALASLSAFIDSRSRRRLVCLFFFVRSMEYALHMSHRHGKVRKVRGGELFFFMVVTVFCLYTFSCEPDLFPKGADKIMWEASQPTPGQEFERDLYREWFRRFWNGVL